MNAVQMFDISSTNGKPVTTKEVEDFLRMKQDVDVALVCGGTWVNLLAQAAIRNPMAYRAVKGVATAEEQKVMCEAEELIVLAVDAVAAQK